MPNEHQEFSAGTDLLPVESIAEEYAYLSQNFCACGGTWNVVQRSSEHVPLRVRDHFRVQCSHCGSQRSFTFEINVEAASYRAAMMVARTYTEPMSADDAESLLREALKLDPGNQIALTALGHLHARSGKGWQAAIRQDLDGKETEDRSPLSAVFLDAISNCIKNQERHESLEQAPSAAAKVSPGGPEATPSTAHPAADPEGHARRSVEYSRALAQWHALPWWKRIRMPKPKAPPGVLA
jgi:hypothetical protein